MGKKWLVTKTKAEVEADMQKIIDAFGVKGADPRRIQGGKGVSNFNFDFTYKDHTFTGYGLKNVTEFVMELGYVLTMWHFCTQYGKTLRLFLRVWGVIHND